MEPNDAAENLQVIRTLMERSAVYRRALAPVMLAVGIIGSVAAPIGVQMGDKSLAQFVYFWSAVCALAVTTALIVVRRQAIRSNEPFWSAPTRRIATAMFPPLFAGAALLFAIIATAPNSRAAQCESLLLVPLWLFFYGCAVHSAGLFISAGMRRLGWAFIFAGLLVFTLSMPDPSDRKLPSANIIMGATFGGLHLLAAAYLFLTERRAKKP